MTSVRFVVALTASTVVAGTLVACTLTRSLDYLTSSPREGGVIDESGGGSSGTGSDDGGDTAETIAEGQLHPRNLAQDSENLYWSNEDGAIMALPKGGGQPPREVTTPGSRKAPVRWISAESRRDGALFVIAGAAVYRVAKGGGDLEPIATSGPPPQALAVDESALFIAQPAESGLGGGFLARYAKDGSSKVVLDDEDESSVVALHGGSVFWAGHSRNDLTENAILELPISANPGTVPKEYVGPAFPPYTPEAFAVDDEAIYYFEDPGDTPGVVQQNTVRLSRTQPASPKIIFPPPERIEPVAFALDEDFLFIAEKGEKGAIIRVRKDGSGDYQFIAEDPRTPTAVAVDATYVYFTVQGSGISRDGVVRRAAKPK